MINLLIILVFIALYGLSMAGEKKGVVFFLMGLLIHAGYVLYRYLHLGWLPVTERHDILIAMALAVAGSFFYLYKKLSLNELLSTLPLFVVILSFFAVFQVRMDSIDPNMNSPWFFAHIIFLICGYSLLTVSSVAGILYLRARSLMHELIQYRLALFGWLLFSFSLIGGSFWFFLVYGSYWLWTAKELWITIVWFYYGFYLHSRLLRSLSGRPAAILGLAGFPILMFSYLGVMPILGSPWSQF
jgi:ABC-type transport system involved in cytochrome c biogenesis permease subunit